MRVDTPANVFSAAKAVASVVMHKLHADNAVDLDVPVATYLPGFEQGGKEAITLREIINHQAGIPALPPAAFDLDLLSDADAIEAFMLELTPSRKRDGAPAYHAISGGFVMDAVVRRVLGKSMRDVLSEQFKQPLGLRWFDFGVSPRDEPKVAHNVATGIRLGPLLGRVMNRLLGIPWDEAVELSNDPRFLCGVIPSGNLITTARDAATFYQCLMNLGELNGVRVMDADVVRELIYDPQARVRVDRMLGMPMRYGNGFMTGTDTISLYGWNHPRAFGHIGMSNTFTWADPDRELAVALLTTGKPVLGTHLLAFPRLMSEIHRVFT